MNVKKYADEIRALMDSIYADLDLGCYAAYGVRVQDVPYKLGRIDHVSHMWDNGEDTGMELDGICCTSVTMLDLASSYYGDHVAIIAGDNYIYGDDPGEIIISDPVVIAILS